MADAAEKAVKKKFWSSDQEAMVFLLLILIVIGTVNVFSASFVLSEMDYGTPYHFLGRHGVNLVVGICCFIGCASFDYHKWRHFMPLILIITVAMLILVLFIGVSVNGAKRWLFFIQPAEVAKLVSTMIIAAYISSRLQARRGVHIFNRQIFIIGIIAVLIELEPDAGTMAIVIGIPLMMMMIGGLSGKKIAALFLLMAIGFVGIVHLQPYRIARMSVLLDPWADAQNIGYQTVRAISAIGSGGMFGMGIGRGVSKYDYLPEAHTDFAFAVFGQETGFIGVLILLGVYSLFLIYGVRIASKARDLYGEILGIGLVQLIGVQAAVNLLMVCGLAPVVGVPLPFISYGGTSLVISLAACGILFNIGSQSSRWRRLKALHDHRIKVRNDDREERRKRLHLVK